MHKNSPMGFSRPRKEELAKRRRRGGLAKDFFSVIGKFFLSAKFYRRKPGSEFLWLATPSQCQCFFLFFFHSYNKRTAFSRHPNAEAQPDSETNASMEMDSCLFVAARIFSFLSLYYKCYADHFHSYLPQRSRGEGSVLPATELLSSPSLYDLPSLRGRPIRSRSRSRCPLSCESTSVSCTTTDLSSRSEAAGIHTED